MKNTNSHQAGSIRCISNAATMLANFSFPVIELNKSTLGEWNDIFFDSVITEYDARRLYWFLEENYSDSFVPLEDVLQSWLRDEIDHAYGFSLIYSHFAGKPYDQVALEVELRKPNFSIIKPVAADPYKLLIMLAYDEIITTHVYHRSIKKYDDFNSPTLSQWIRKIKKDEIRHFFAFVDKARKMFPHRTGEVSSILEEIFVMDFEKENYTGTFVLDHNTPDFPISKLEIKKTIIPAIIKKFNE